MIADYHMISGSQTKATCVVGYKSSRRLKMVSGRPPPPPRYLVLLLPRAPPVGLLKSLIVRSAIVQQTASSGSGSRQQHGLFAAALTRVRSYRMHNIAMAVMEPMVLELNPRNSAALTYVKRQSGFFHRLEHAHHAVLEISFDETEVDTSVDGITGIYSMMMMHGRLQWRSSATGMKTTYQMVV